MRTFSLTVQCEDTRELSLALTSAGLMLSAMPTISDRMRVDESFDFETEAVDRAAKSVTLSRHE